jgi:diguanylate cyclase (GGDEF)-like protein
LQLLEHAFRAGRRSKAIAAVLFLDLDRFKDVNDAYGHQTGDELLVAVAERLKGMLRPGDNLARLAGDEFVIVCEDLADPLAADPIAARLAEQLALPFQLSSVEVTTGASIGIAFTGPGVDSPEALLHDADLEMYRSKHDRRGDPCLRRCSSRSSSSRGRSSIEVSSCSSRRAQTASVDSSTQRSRSRWRSTSPRIS